jgi:2-oxoglutarate dehydrogenase E2 component (dihydrolipoamide succinyltransferase)
MAFMNRCLRPATRALAAHRRLSVSIARQQIRPVSQLHQTRLIGGHQFNSIIMRSFSGGDSSMIVNVPEMGDSITEGSILEWVKSTGDAVDMDDVVVVIETDKVSVDVRAPHSGVITETFGEPDDVVEVGKPLMTIDTSAAGPAASKPTASAAPAPTPEPVKPTETPKPAAPAAKPAAAAAPAAAPVVVSDRSENRVKMTRMRQTVSRRLKESQNTYAMLTTFQECDMGNLMEMRTKYKDEFEKKHGCRLGFMSAFVKASAAALQEVPAINAVIDDKTDEIVYKNYCDISVAVASPKGLVVPVLRDTQKMSFKDIETGIADYAEKAKNNTLAMEDMVGGTFTISNGGVFGSLYGTPIINMPQSAILGMHATKMRPMVVKGEVVPRPMMFLALTYDHRLIDGREAVTFLKSIANKIEDPQRLLLDL